MDLIPARRRCQTLYLNLTVWVDGYMNGCNIEMRRNISPGLHQQWDDRAGEICINNKHSLQPSESNPRRSEEREMDVSGLCLFSLSVCVMGLKGQIWALPCGSARINTRAAGAPALEFGRAQTCLNRCFRATIKELISSFDFPSIREHPRLLEQHICP